jgi:hypothetical protein
MLLEMSLRRMRTLRGGICLTFGTFQSIMSVSSTPSATVAIITTPKLGITIARAAIITRSGAAGSARMCTWTPRMAFWGLICMRIARMIR